MKPNSPPDVNSGDNDRRPLPHNLHAEQILLGGLFMADDSYDLVSDLIQSDHFFDPIHAKIYASIEELLRKGMKATPVTLMPFFENVAMRGGQSVAEYLTQVAIAGAPPRTIKSYAQTVYDLALRRQLIQTGRELTDTSFEMPIENTPLELIEKAEQDLYRIAEKKHETATINFANSIRIVTDEARRAFESGGLDAGLSTGLSKLDNALGGGIHGGQLIVIAGRPGMGKTALGVNIGYHAAKRARMAADDLAQGKEPDNKTSRRGCPVGFFSLEMQHDELTRRVLAQESGVTANKIKAGKFSAAENATILEAADRIASTPFFMDQTGGISVPKLAQRALRMKRQHGIDVLIVDYLQLITASKKHNGNRVQEISEISGSLKTLAKDLDIPVIALSQLSRDVEKRDDKRPNLADLRDGGTIEQDADVVLFVYREEYYWLKKNPKPNSPTGETDWRERWRDEGKKGQAELIAAKQRNGPASTVMAYWDADFTRFYDVQKDAA